ncbi:MAG: GTP-binding protein, partial [Proteobacteria bacterium]|nr:GTP-binding protein [Pseudomonadota bacterium]
METEKRQTSEPEGKSGLILVSGFLGAGKTTLLKHILSWKRDMSDTVVIVNEFGDIGIDGSLLAGQASDIVELTSGCICCTMVLDLTSTLQGIWRRSNPQWILVEASGIADPKAVVSAMQSDELRRRIGFLKTVTVLDAEIWEMREVMGRIFYNQLETADMVLLNKVDRLDKETVKKCLEETGEFLPHTQIVPTTHCRIDADSLLLTSP